MKLSIIIWVVDLDGIKSSFGNVGGDWADGRGILFWHTTQILKIEKRKLELNVWKKKPVQAGKNPLKLT